MITIFYNEINIDLKDMIINKFNKKNIKLQSWYSDVCNIVYNIFIKIE